MTRAGGAPGKPHGQPSTPGKAASGAVLANLVLSGSGQDVRRHPPRPLSGVAGVFLCGVFAFLDLYATQPILPMLQSVFHASKAAVGLTVSASTLGVAAAAPLLGILTERLERKAVILASVAGLAIPTLAAATAGTLHALVFWRFLQGVLTPGVFAITIAYITEEWEAGAVAPVMSVYVSGTALGGFFGRTLTGIIADRYGWHMSFIVLGALEGVGALLLLRLLPRGRRHSSAMVPGHAAQGQLAVIVAHLRNTQLLTTYVIGFNVLFSLVGVFSYVTFYLAAPPFSLSTEKLSYLFAVYLAGLVATPLAGALLPRIGLRAGICSALAISLVGVLITLTHSVALVTAGLALCCTGVFISQACATSYLREAAPAHSRASVVGLYVTFYYVGGTLAGVAPGYLWKAGGWPACVTLIAAVDVASIAIAWWGWSPSRRAAQR